MYNPRFAAARAQQGSRQVVGSFYRSRAASRMEAAIQAGSDGRLSLFVSDSSGFEEGFDGVEVFQNVAHAMFVAPFR